MNMKVAVIGAGTMGSGIAQVAATAGHEVVVIDRDASALDRGRQILAKSFAALVARSRLEQHDADMIAGRVRWSQDLADVAGAGLIIEAVLEDLEVKQRLFADVGAVAGRAARRCSRGHHLSLHAWRGGLLRSADARLWRCPHRSLRCLSLSPVRARVVR